MVHKNQFPEVVGHEAKDRKRSTSMYVVRLIVAVVLLLASCTYIVAIVKGRLSALQKLGLADIAVFALAVGVASVMLRPELLDRISHFKFGELELDWLQKIEADQRKQRDELDAVRFVLTLLLQESELEHLRNLEKGSTQYQGNETVCAELRKLRTLGLIRNRKDRTIGEISAKRSFDLKDIVELTERGRQYLERLGEYAEKTS
jgi:hypothetical protein